MYLYNKKPKCSSSRLVCNWLKVQENVKLFVLQTSVFMITIMNKNNMITNTILQHQAA